VSERLGLREEVKESWRETKGGALGNKKKATEYDEERDSHELVAVQVYVLRKRRREERHKENLKDEGGGKHRLPNRAQKSKRDLI